MVNNAYAHKRACLLFCHVFGVVGLGLVFAFCSVVELVLILGFTYIKSPQTSDIFESRIRIFLLVWFVTFTQFS